MVIRRGLVTTAVLLAVLLVASACSPGGEVSAPAERSATASPTIAPERDEVTQGPQPTEALDSTPEPTQEVAATDPPEELPLGSPSLKASDPTTVSLAAGQPQLLEFFAFW